MELSRKVQNVLGHWVTGSCGSLGQGTKSAGLASISTAKSVPVSLPLCLFVLTTPKVGSMCTRVDGGARKINGKKIKTYFLHLIFQNVLRKGGYKT